MVAYRRGAFDEEEFNSNFGLGSAPPISDKTKGKLGLDPTKTKKPESKKSEGIKPKKKPAGGMSRNERNLRRRQGRL